MQKFSHACIIRLRERFIKQQGLRSITSYMFDIKGSANEFAMLSQLLKDEEVNIYVINGSNKALKETYEQSIRSRDKGILFRSSGKIARI